MKPLFYKFARYMQNKWCLIIKDYKKTVDNIYKVKDDTNLFFSINWYKKWYQNREEKNIEKLNFFFFDIDMKDNLSYQKEEILEKILEFEKDFTFIVESKNWFHLYIELQDWQYNNNWVLHFDQYKKDWRIKFEYYENIFWINLDKNCIKTTQIARLPATTHKKPNQDTFFVKLITWENKLEDSFVEQINKIPITDILDKLGIHYDVSDASLYENNQSTNGWKVNVDGNYIQDFSWKNRPIWEPFAFVLNYFKSKNWEKNHEKNYIETYNFFKFHFWIISSSKKSKIIKMNKLISKNLYNSELSEENILYFLRIQFLLNKYDTWDGEWSPFISVEEILKTLWLESMKKSTLVNNIKKLQEKSRVKLEKPLKTKDQKEITFFDLIEVKMIQEKGIKYQFRILPEYEYFKNNVYDSRLFHFLPVNILKIEVNNNRLFRLYLTIFQRLILSKKESIFLSNTQINEYSINKNLSLRNKKLNEFGVLLWDFEFVKKWNDGFDVVKK